MKETEKLIKTREYIKNAWKKAIRSRASNAKFILPYDFIPPCVDENFITLYYWDTFFTNEGLYLDGLEKYAFYNIENLKFCLEKFACVPNCCWENGAKHASQPPLLFLMVKRYFEVSGDKEFLKSSYNALEKEYAFWMRERICDNGLNRYGTNRPYASLQRGELLREIAYYARRVGIDVAGWDNEELKQKLFHIMAEGESGEDHTPRFKGLAFDVCAIDLNSLLYAFERTMASFARILGYGESAWEEKAALRKKRINALCLDESSGLYFDYNYREKRQTKMLCSACYLPFVFGLSTNVAALNRLNEALVAPHGVLACQEVENRQEVYQWGYPNAWAPHQYYAYEANARLGNTEWSAKIAKNWLNTLATEYEKSGKLFEKYDAFVGGMATVNEYGTPEMLGWTAGVFNYFYDKEIEKQR